MTIIETLKAEADRSVEVVQGFHMELRGVLCSSILSVQGRFHTTCILSRIVKRIVNISDFRHISRGLVIHFINIAANSIYIWGSTIFADGISIIVHIFFPMPSKAKGR